MLILSLVFSVFALLAGCDGNGQEPSDLSDSGEFPDSLLVDFLKWESVLPEEGSFTSRGHSGPLVRGYFNEVASATFKGEDDFPFAEGSLVAKAVIADVNTPSSAASRVYFMRKMADGYDPANNNWAYAFADRQGDGYQFSTSQGRVQVCISCHARQRTYDFVRTVQFYRDAH